MEQKVPEGLASGDNPTLEATKSMGAHKWGAAERGSGAVRGVFRSPQENDQGEVFFLDFELLMGVPNFFEI